MAILRTVLNAIYVFYFVTHLPVTLLLDTQTLYPADPVPAPLKQFLNDHIQNTRDPLMAGAFGLNGDASYLWAWFRSFMVIDILLYVPIMVAIASRKLKESSTMFPLVFVYGASKATAVAACLAVMLSAPMGPVDSSIDKQPVSADFVSTPDVPDLIQFPLQTPEQRVKLFWMYLPNLIIPLIMTVDVGLRISSGLRDVAVRKEKGKGKEAKLE